LEETGPYALEVAQETDAASNAGAKNAKAVRRDFRNPADPNLFPCGDASARSDGARYQVSRSSLRVNFVRFFHSL
jgi:hypothetical protein